MKKSALIIACCAGLVACTGQAPVAISQDPVKAAFLQTAPMDRIGEGTVTTTVPAYRTVSAEDGSTTRQEVSGAKCTLRSDHLQAEVITPQEVILPNYDQDKKYENRGVPPSILVSCKSGDESGSNLLTAKPGQVVAGSSNLFADIILITASAVASNVRDWRYEAAISVDMK